MITGPIGDCPANCRRSQSGFGLVEFLVAALILLVTASAVFGMVTEVQRRALSQAEIQSVLDNTRIAMQTIGRYLRQAGNDPRNSGLAGITIVSATEVRILSDLTGSAGPRNPDKGDPDGDTSDSGENVILRYNGATRSLEIMPDGGSAQIIAGNISDLTFRYYDSGGATITAGSNVHKINVTISGTSLLPDPGTHKVFGVRLSSDFQVKT